VGGGGGRFVVRVVVEGGKECALGLVEEGEGGLEVGWGWRDHAIITNVATV